ncbi:MAG: hypothetical protein KC464_21790 [Myxococcales bacterium]|nr:hypothetical protein [Myxococcales bacterium]
MSKLRLGVLAATLAAAASACGTETDDRPATAQYVVTTILRPSCATAACHSSQTAVQGLVFDTVAGACAAYDEHDVQAFLVGNGAGGLRMPADSPLPTADVDLLQQWLDDGQPGCP